MFELNAFELILIFFIRIEIEYFSALEAVHSFVLDLLQHVSTHIDALHQLRQQLLLHLLQDFS